MSRWSRLHQHSLPSTRINYSPSLPQHHQLTTIAVLVGFEPSYHLQLVYLFHVVRLLKIQIVVGFITSWRLSSNYRRGHTGPKNLLQQLNYISLEPAAYNLSPTVPVLHKTTYLIRHAHILSPHFLSFRLVPSLILIQKIQIPSHFFFSSSIIRPYWY